MKRMAYRIILLFIIMTLSGIPNIQWTFAKTIPVTDNYSKIILIDPGHGGIDGGAVSKNGTSEKNINLAIGLKLGELLKEKGYKVVLTREEDKGLYEDKGRIRDKKIQDLNNRCKLKEESGCDIFLSVHLNKFPQSKYKGAQVWYSRNEESKKLAGIIQNNLKKDLDPSNNRSEKPAGDSYKILRCHNTIPSVIVECGFLSNDEEENLLKKESYQEKIAISLSNAIEEYFKEVV